MASQPSTAGLTGHRPAAHAGILRRWGRPLLAFAALLASATILAAVLFPETWLCIEDPIGPADVIIILGGDARRSERAAHLFQNGHAPCVVVSGAGDWSEYRDHLIRLGVPPEAIHIENQSLTTFENARQTSRWLTERHARTALLVTSWFHSRRAIYTFRKAAPNVVFQSAPAYLSRRPHTLGLTPGEAGTVLREYVKIAGYLLRHGVWPVGVLALVPGLGRVRAMESCGGGQPAVAPTWRPSLGPRNRSQLRLTIHPL